MNDDTTTIAETILALERAAMERYNKGDVDGPLEIYAEDVSYFDPITETRLDGRATVAEYFRAFFEGKLDIPRYEILNPQVIVSGDMAVLTYNLRTTFVEKTEPRRPEPPGTRPRCTAAWIVNGVSSTCIGHLPSTQQRSKV